MAQRFRGEVGRGAEAEVAEDGGDEGGDVEGDERAAGGGFVEVEGGELVAGEEEERGGEDDGCGVGLLDGEPGVGELG